MKIRLLTIIGHADLRNSLHDLFNWAGDICIAAEASSAEECLEHLKDGEFDGLLLDTALAGEIRRLLDQLHERMDRLPILALCPGNIPPLVIRALGNGATTCIDKEGDPLSILTSIRTAVQSHADRSSAGWDAA